jgi:site-specific DNA recombinase
MTRCAVYARYSSDQQSPASIDDQIRKCREYAAEHGLEVLEHHIYADAAISGAGADRAGFQAMVKAGLKTPPAFDVLLIDDTSRLSRRMVDQMDAWERLCFAGVRVVSVSQGIDSDNEQAATLMTVHGLIDSLYIKELGKKTFRGLEGCALRGQSTGGRTYGYTNQTLDGEKRQVVNADEAEIVRRLFELHAAGMSLKNIARKLNEDKVTPPRSGKGRRQGSWCFSTIREMLRNEIYIGRVIWNRSRFEKRPGTNKRVKRARPRSEWKIMERPELRVIDPELWQRVVDRRKVVNELFAKPGAGTRRTSGAYPLSGFLKCGECGGNMIILSGRASRHGKPALKYYGCGVAHNRGVCPNKVTIRQDRIEASFFAGIQEKVLTKQFIDYVLAEMGRQMREAKRNVSGEVAALEKRRGEIEQELVNLTEAIAATRGSQAVMTAIVQREREREDVCAKLASVGRDSFEKQTDDLREFVTSSLSKIQDIMAEDTARGRALLAEHAKEIRLRPTQEGYIVEGRANGAFSGDVCLKVLRG